MKAWNMVKTPAAVAAAVLVVFGTTGCATKKHVRQTVAPVEARVSAGEKKSSDQQAQIGELQNNVSRADEKAMDADRKAVAAGQDAARANESAGKAGESAREAGTRADNARGLAEQARSRIGEVVENLDNYKLVTTDSVHFPLNKFTLTKEGKEQLDQAIANIQNSKNYVLEIQGFADPTGSKASNLALSERRADTVVRYLTVEHQIPLRKIHVLGVGEDAIPKEETRTREGRKQARRVDIKVFALDMPGREGTQASSGQTMPRATQGSANTTTGTTGNRGTEGTANRATETTVPNR